MTKELVGEAWYNALKEEFTEPYFINLAATLAKEYADFKVFPKPEEVFNAFLLVPLNEVKVIFISQDPYPHDAAHGLAFSSQKQEVPYSLKMILREIDRSIWKTKDFSEYKRMVETNDLTSWAKQGVFLLNSVLTVRAGNPNSHAGIGWQEFTSRALQLLWGDNRPKVFCLWGSEANKTFISIIEKLSEDKPHLTLSAGHPASGAHGKDMFSGNNHFVKINRFLYDTGQDPINWEVKKVIT